MHCKAGKSRSVTAVMAYLIHANHWTLSRAYAFVLERSKGISPNIGFQEELGGVPVLAARRKVRVSDSPLPSWIESIYSYVALIKLFSALHTTRLNLRLLGSLNLIWKKKNSDSREST